MVQRGVGDAHFWNGEHHALPSACLAALAGSGACGAGPGDGGCWHPAAGRQHRHQPAHASRPGARAGLPGLLRAASPAQLLLLRRAVLGVPGGRVVRQRLVQRPVASVGPEYVPLYVLRVPVRYYRQPPGYFRSWRDDAPPRWGERWGRDWEQRRPGWDRWDRSAAPAPAPLPTYQRKYPQSATRRQPIGNSRFSPRTTVTSRGIRWSASSSRSRNVPRPRLRVVPLRARPIAGRTRRATTRRATTRRAATAPIVTAAVESTLNPATDGLPGSRVWRGPGGRP